jgi:hypothetical protein
MAMRAMTLPYSYALSQESHTQILETTCCEELRMVLVGERLEFISFVKDTKVEVHSVPAMYHLPVQITWTTGIAFSIFA